jgi:hypothetical protein
MTRRRATLRVRIPNALELLKTHTPTRSQIALPAGTASITLRIPGPITREYTISNQRFDWMPNEPSCRNHICPFQEDALSPGWSFSATNVLEDCSCPSHGADCGCWTQHCDHGVWMRLQLQWTHSCWKRGTSYKETFTARCGKREISRQPT